MIHRQFPYRKISVYFLWKLYRKHGIKRKAVILTKKGSDKNMAKIELMKEEAK